MKKYLRSFGICVLICMLLSSAAAAREVTGAQEYTFIHALVDYIEKNAKFPVPEEVLLDAALKERLSHPESGFNGMVNAVMDCLDEHSSYLDSASYRAFLERSVAGNFVGIGILLWDTESGYVVVSTVDDSPAQAAGIRPGDVLVAVDGVNIEDESFDTVRGYIAGRENTVVTVTVRRVGTEMQFTLRRARVENQSVTYEKRDGIGYIVLEQFNTSAVSEVKEALRDFDAEGIKDIILDLRDNPGGEIHAALDMCRLFAPKGVIMRVEYGDSSRNQLYYNEEDQKGKYRLVVLVNGESASASELFAGSVQDTGSGVIIGTRTYGKGTVQVLQPIVSGGAIRLTVAEYKTAGGRAVHHKGIEPDIYAENTYSVPDISYMAEMELTKDWKEGDTGDGVLAIEQRLVFLGYMDAADDTAAHDTTEALMLFQARNGLPITGIADIYTQIRLHDADYEEKVENDDQLAAAMEYYHESR